MNCINARFEEFQNEIRTLFLRWNQLDLEIKIRKQRMRDADKKPEIMEDDGKSGFEAGGKDGIEEPADLPKPVRRSQESERKEELLEFLVWVLEDTSKENRKLLGNLTGMLEKQSLDLADMLERIPPEYLGMQTPSDEDDLAGQYARLRHWHEALTRREKMMEQEEARLRGDQRFAILQQKEQGIAHWNSFLASQRGQFERKITGLEAELRKLG